MSPSTRKNIKQALASTLWVLVVLLCASNVMASDRTIEAKLNDADATLTQDPDRFEQLMQELAQMDLALNESQLERYTLLRAHRDIFLNRHQSARAALTRLIDRSSSQELRFEAQTLLVFSYGLMRDWQQGLTVAEDAMAQMPELSSQSQKNRAMATLGLFFNQLGLYHLGTEYAAKILNAQPSPREACLARRLIIESHSFDNRLDPNGMPLQLAVRDCQAANESIMLASIHQLTAQHWLNHEQADTALALLVEHQALFAKSQYAPLQISYYRLSAQAYFRLGFMGQARRYAQSAIELGESLQVATPELKRAYYLRYQIELLAQNNQDALAYLQAYTQLGTSDELSDGEKQLAMQLTRFRNSEKLSQIQMLNQKNQMLTLEQRLAQQQASNNRLFIALLTSLSLALLFWLYRIHRKHRQVSRIAQFDSLTDSYNRRFFTKQAKGLLQLNRKRSQAVAMIVLDIDHFKSINDTFGHPVGDVVLQQAARVCKDVCRKNDLFGRLGGEEFGFILPGCSQHQALALAEQCRQALLALGSEQVGKRILVSASFGVTTTKISGYDYKQLLADADFAMYRAKNLGRNRVVLFEGSPNASPDAHFSPHLPSQPR
ncbi:GGDEF domain-containing protein [Paraferrimonas sedimenticola]|uniref:diguanylate cyclase n=1 Tax=Paraferrimonas sedimenticola TaxID=375674 RepID=A0AA37VTW2_9GAMM|nr:GGDEF domain-containing protein [Paraferrimonas sedimenticola]GLP95574.1 GGDEF domain-containing protein [Paraferrimonas sedimenticola]